MRTETESMTATPPAPQDLLDETLTDVIDRLRRHAFKRQLERRPANAYRFTIEASQLVRTKSS